MARSHVNCRFASCRAACSAGQPCAAARASSLAQTARSAPGKVDAGPNVWLCVARHVIRDIEEAGRFLPTGSHSPSLGQVVGHRCSGVRPITDGSIFAVEARWCPKWRARFAVAAYSEITERQL